MRGFILALVLLLAPTITVLADEPTAGAPSQQTLCAGGEGITRDTQRAACTVIIDQGSAPREDLAEAYRQRCEVLNDPATRDTALADCDRAVALAPTYAAYLSRAGVYRDRASAARRDDYDRAIGDYTTALSLNSDLPSAYVLRGTAFAGKGDYDRAIADYTKAIELNPYLKVFAGSLLKQAQTAKARLAQGQKRGDPRAWCDGKGLPDEGFPLDLQIRGCTMLIDSGKASRDDRALDYFKRGEAHDFQRDYDHAIADYNAALAIYRAAPAIPPAIAVAYLRIGMIYYVKNDNDNAITYLDKAVAMNAQDTSALSYRGYSYAGKGAFDAAIADYDAVLRLEPTSADSLLNRARAYFGKGDFDKALADANQAIHLSQTSEATEGYDVRGDVHFRKADFKTAIVDYEAALKLWPEYPEALYGRGAAKTRNGDATGGSDDIAGARKLKPETEAAEMKRGIAP
jgi:tetratricopeptide (TPR) repeat protein